MSDFDKEAEREKLREQFAEDEEDRENTERMSELLLKGATMTNKHCDECGDPVFRYRGQEFCPTCSAQAGAGGVDDQLAAASDRDAQQQASAGQQQAGASEQTPTDANGAPAAANDGAVDHAASAPGQPDASHPQPHPQSQPQPQPQPQAQQPAGQSRPFADLSEARGSLSRTVTRFAAAAEEADDLARAREYLDAVEDAADALRAVREAER